MSLRDINSKHLRLISLYSGRYAIRGGTGLLFVVLVLTCGLLIAQAILTPVEQQKQMAKSLDGVNLDDATVLAGMVEQARPFVAWAVGGKVVSGEADRDEAIREWTSYLLDRRPAVLSAVFLVMIFSLPFLVAFGAFNQFSGDIGSRGLRFHLLRTERPNIFFGRFLGTAIFNVAVVAALLAVIVLYVGFKLDVYSWPSLLSWSLQGLVAFALVCLPYVALCSWISAAVDSPLLSLVLTSLVIGAVPLFAVIGRYTWEPMQSVMFLLPWGVQNYLLHNDWIVVLGAAAACLGYTALFLFLGHRHFQKRDL